MAKKADDPIEQTQEEKNLAQAKIIFETQPHVHTIWFDEKGEWRFYETPGTTAINKADVFAAE